MKLLRKYPEHAARRDQMRDEREVSSEPAGPFPFAQDYDLITQDQPDVRLRGIDVAQQVDGSSSLVLAKRIGRTLDGKGHTSVFDRYFDDAASCNGPRQLLRIKSISESRLWCQGCSFCGTNYCS